MPIYADPSELRSTSKFKKHCKLPYTSLPDLEKHTGADNMIVDDNDTETISLLDNLTHPDAIKLAVLNGAVLVQLKFDSDMTSSITDNRIGDAHIRMVNIGAKPNQRWLVFIGIMHQGHDGLYINSTKAYGNASLKSYYSAMIGWTMRGNPQSGFGGHYAEISNVSFLNIWLERMQKFANTMNDPKLIYEGQKMVFQCDTIFGQVTESVNDIRKPIAAIIGPKMAQNLHNICLDRGQELTWDWFVYEVVTLSGENLPGFGKGIAKKTREMLKL